jgi:hypothetical protein
MRVRSRWAERCQQALRLASPAQSKELRECGDLEQLLCVTVAGRRQGL